ncbi:lysophospholipid acyltransferase family protein [Chloroflexota bacterium]
MKSWYPILKLILKVYVTLYVDEIRVSGEEHIPAGPKIIVANHPNATDGFTLPFVFPETLHFLIQGSVFSTPLIGRILAWAEQIPVIKGNGSFALEMAKEKLEQGNSVVIFPEGRLNNDQTLHKGRLGAARLAVETGVPLLPLGFFVPSDALRSFSKNIHEEDRISTSRWQWGGNCFIRIGKPFQPGDNHQAGDVENYLCDLTENIMAKIAGLVDLARGDSNHAN